MADTSLRSFGDAAGSALSALLDAVPHPIAALGEDGSVVWANAAARAFCERSSGSGPAGLPEDLCARARGCLESREPVQGWATGQGYQWMLIPAPAPERWVALLGCPVDDAELDRTTHLKSVGELAAGIAHEINTPMQYIGDNVSFLRDSFGAFQRLGASVAKVLAELRQSGAAPESRAELERVLQEGDIEYLSEEIVSALDQTREGVGRVATIVRAVKEFSHVSPDEMAKADLNHAIETALTVGRNEVKYVAEVRTELGAIPHVTCHVSQVHQVILNLVVNAAHAVGDRVDRQKGERGAITVRTRAEGDSVVIEIQDTGTGIPEHVRDRIFEPFFTTKERGRGTGQGLMLAKRIIEEVHGGSLRFETETGVGTTFFATLPIEAVDGDDGHD